jgi:hypothetical protein
MSNTERISEGGVGRAVQTPGIGKRTTAHLNLTRSLADVGWPGVDHPAKANEYFPTERVWAYGHQPKIQYAGAES